MSNPRPACTASTVLNKRVALAAALLCVLSAACTKPKTRTPPSAEPAPAHPITDDNQPGGQPAPATGTTPTTIGARFKDAPFATLLNPPPTVALKAGGEIPIYAAQCGACHSDIYQEWTKSTHAAALRDPQYIAELSKAGSPRWLCLNCHIPLQAQRDYIVDADTVVHASKSDVRVIEKKRNPDFDPRLQKEAITCATCHVRADNDGKGVIHGPRGSDTAPHRVVKSDLPKNMCVRCHDPGPVQLTTTFSCWFETRREAEAAGKNATCKDCHMPTAHRPVAVGQPARDSVRHTFVGPVPKTFAGFLDRDERGFVRGVTVKVQRVDDLLRVTLKNENAPHHVTSADPERHLRLELSTVSARGETETRTERVGQKWDWGDATSGRPARRIADNRLAAGESRSYDVPLDGVKTVDVTLRHVRLTDDNMAHMSKAVVDAELQQLAPNAADDLRNMRARYPTQATMYRARYSVETAELRETPLQDLARLDAKPR